MILNSLFFQGGAKFYNFARAMAILLYIDGILFFLTYLGYFLFLLAAYCYLRQYKIFKVKEENQLQVVEAVCDKDEEGSMHVKQKNSREVTKDHIANLISQNLERQMK